MSRTIAIALMFAMFATSAHAMSAAERLYNRKMGRKPAAVKIVRSNDDAPITVTVQPSKRAYESAYKYYGLLGLGNRDRAANQRKRELAKAINGQDRMDYCEKYWDSLRNAACLGEPGL